MNFRPYVFSPGGYQLDLWDFSQVMDLGTLCFMCCFLKTRPYISQGLKKYDYLLLSFVITLVIYLLSITLFWHNKLLYLINCAGSSVLY